MGKRFFRSRCATSFGTLALLLCFRAVCITCPSGGTSANGVRLSAAIGPWAIWRATRNYGTTPGTEIRPLSNTATREVFIYLEDKLYTVQANAEGCGPRALSLRDLIFRTMPSVPWRMTANTAARFAWAAIPTGCSCFRASRLPTLTFDGFVPGKQGNAYKAQVPFGNGRVFTSDGSILGLGRTRQVPDGLFRGCRPQYDGPRCRRQLLDQTHFGSDPADNRLNVCSAPGACPIPYPYFLPIPTATCG